MFGVRAWLGALGLACVSCADAPPRPVAASAPTSPPARLDAPRPPSPVVATSASPAGDPAPVGPAAAPPRASLTSVGYFTWIYKTPKVDDHAYLGYVRFGQRVALKREALVRGLGCAKGFYAIEPRGFVCRDHTVDLAPPPRFEAEAEAVAPASGALPFHYALSNGAPMYARLPSEKEQAKVERAYGKAGAFVRLPKVLAAHEELARAAPVAAVDAPPGFVVDGAPLLPERLDLVKQPIPAGSMLSFTRSFEANGRTWLLSADLTLVPADRVRAFEPSRFHGTKIGGDVALPIAWFKGAGAQKHLVSAGAVTASSASFAPRTFVAITGAEVEIAGTKYLETRAPLGDGRAWVAARDATVVEAAEKLPYLVSPGERWIVVSISKGTLVAYDGLTPVYSTLVSPGKGGVPVAGRDLVESATTPLGAFRITFKDRAATMSPEQGEGRSFWIADVPFTQYFAPPFALHAAYWHERFGEPTSAGCINLSPLDAEALFDFTEPRVPDGWAGATGASAMKENGRASWIVIRR
ncbi:MAG TPA: L,D-transpeptidase [Byssovorax sp.]